MNKNVLYILPYPKFFSQHSGVGGHIAHASGIVSGFVEHGFEVTVVTEENHEIFDLEGVSVRQVPCPSSAQLRRQIWAIRLLKQLQTMMQNHSFDFCYIRYSASFAPWLPFLKKILGSVPLVLEVNSLGSQWKTILRPLDRLALSSADRVICISEVLKDYTTKLLEKKALAKDIRVVINGVNVNRFNLDSVVLGEPDFIHVGYAGLLKPDYGIEYLIESARLLSDEKSIFFHIFGDGPQRGQLEALGRDLENLRFHGPILFADMPSYLKALDIVVYTTDQKNVYGSPTKLFEYMAVSKPIVVAKTPQTLEILKDNETSIFYNIGDSVGLADSIKMLTQNQELRTRLGKKARLEVETKHTWFARIDEIIS